MSPKKETSIFLNKIIKFNDFLENRAYDLMMIKCKILMKTEAIKIVFNHDSVGFTFEEYGYNDNDTYDVVLSVEEIDMSQEDWDNHLTKLRQEYQ